MKAIYSDPFTFAEQAQFQMKKGFAQFHICYISILAIFWCVTTLFPPGYSLLLTPQKSTFVQTVFHLVEGSAGSTKSSFKSIYQTCSHD